MGQLLIANLDVERIEVELVGDVRVILLRLQAVLGEDTTLESYGSRCPVIRCHRVGKRDDKVELTNLQQRSIDRTQELLRSVVHSDGC